MLNSIYFFFFVYFQASFSSVSSFEFISSQQHSHQQYNPLDTFSEALFPSETTPSNNSSPISHYLENSGKVNFSNNFIEPPQHSSSSSDTIIGQLRGSTDSLISQYKEEPVTPTAELYQKSPVELGPLTLRSSSDPSIPLHAFQSIQQAENQQRPGTSASPLPSFQETYSIKYNQLASLGLKMDEDCYNMASPHHPASAYHHGHGHAITHHPHYEFSQHGAPHYVPPGGFYPQPYEPHAMVSFYIQIYINIISFKPFSILISNMVQ